MWTQSRTPQFHETNATGHVDNTVLPRWLEEAREPLLRVFTPDLDPAKWRLIMARFEIDYRAEIDVGIAVEVETYLLKLGKSSFQVGQDIHQGGRHCAHARTVMVQYNYVAHQAMLLDEPLRRELGEHLVEAPTG